MRFSVFIVENLDEIAQQWDAFACTLLPPWNIGTALNAWMPASSDSGFVRIP